jgi:hypothetical protein
MDEAWTSPELHCRHLIVCRTIWFNPAKPEEDFSLGRLVVRLTAEDDDAFPLRVALLFVFAQIYGTPGEYRVSIRLVRLDRAETGEVGESQLGDDGEAVEFRLPRPVVVSGLQLVDAFAVPLAGVAFPTPGLYEFQLWRDGSDEPLARERLEVSA